MSLAPDELVLLILDAAKGSLKGKTLLQKQAYFLSELMGLDLGYRAHYYGPYSPELQDGLAHVKALGYVEERTLGFGATDETGFEIRRYDYKLTRDGEEIVKYVKGQHPTECSRILVCLEKLAKAGDVGDYVQLAIAAKTYHILSQQKKPMMAKDIRTSASSFGWSVSEDSVEKAVSFLEEVGLADRG